MLLKPRRKFFVSAVTCFLQSKLNVLQTLDLILEELKFGLRKKKFQMNTCYSLSFAAIKFPRGILKNLWRINGPRTGLWETLL